MVSTAASAEVSTRDAAAAARVGCYSDPATIVGTRGDDMIVGTPQKDVIVARAGNDVVRSRGGGDLVCGGPGDDRLVSRPRRPGGSTLLQGGPGADRLVAVRSGADLLTGGPGPDKLTSTSDHASTRNLSGGPGADVLTAAGDADITIWLTADGDHVRTRHTSSVFLFYEASPGPVEVDMAARTVRLIGAVDGDHITYLTGPPALYEYLFVYGTTGDDRMIGSDSDDYFYVLPATTSWRDSADTTCSRASRAKTCSTEAAETMDSSRTRARTRSTAVRMPTLPMADRGRTPASTPKT